MLATLKDRTGNTISVEIVEKASGNVFKDRPGGTRVTRFGLTTPAPLLTPSPFLLELADGAMVEVEATSCVAHETGSWYVVAFSEKGAEPSASRNSAA